jgi:hypothetical protein
MTRATLRLGPKEQPNGEAIVEILFLYPDPPTRYRVRSLFTKIEYTAFPHQLTNIVEVKGS